MFAEALKAVQNINDKLENLIGLEVPCGEALDFFRLNLHTDGNIIHVNFCGSRIWDSTNDERNYLDWNGEIYEPIETYLKRKMVEVLNMIKNLLEKLNG